MSDNPSLFELSQLITPQPDGNPTPHLRTAVVSTVGAPTWTILLDGVAVPASALDSAVAVPGDTVQVLTKLGAQPLVLGKVSTTDDGWLPYAPALSNWTLGNGTLIGNYVRSPGVVHFNAELTVGSSTGKVGEPQISLPFPIDVAYSPVAVRASVFAVLYDQTGGSSTAPCYQFGAQAVRPMVLANTSIAAGGTEYVSNFVISPTLPFVWTNPDILSISGWYRPA